MRERSSSSILSDRLYNTRRFNNEEKHTPSVSRHLQDWRVLSLPMTRRQQFPCPSMWFKLAATLIPSCMDSGSHSTRVTTDSGESNQSAPSRQLRLVGWPNLSGSTTSPKSMVSCIPN